MTMMENERSSRNFQPVTIKLENNDLIRKKNERIELSITTISWVQKSAATIDETSTCRISTTKKDTLSYHLVSLHQTSKSKEAGFFLT